MRSAIETAFSMVLTLFVLGFAVWGIYTYIATMIDPPVSRHNPFTVDTMYDRGP